MDITLRSFINRLESLPDKPSMDALKKCILEMDGRQLPIDEYIHFSDQGYKRNIIHISSRCEVTVLCFKKGQFTPIHDHGGSVGITLVRKGCMTEELFEKQSSGIITQSFTRRYYVSELANIHLTTIHRVSNTHDGELITINVYFPPLTLMNIYTLGNDRVEKSDAGYSSGEKM